MNTKLNFMKVYVIITLPEAICPDVLFLGPGGLSGGVILDPLTVFTVRHADNVDKFVVL